MTTMTMRYDERLRIRIVRIVRIIMLMMELATRSFLISSPLEYPISRQNSPAGWP